MWGLLEEQTLVGRLNYPPQLPLLPPIRWWLAVFDKFLIKYQLIRWGLAPGRGHILGQLTRAEANLDTIRVLQIFVQLSREIIRARKYLMFENIFWINHVHDTGWQVFSARSAALSTDFSSNFVEKEDNEKLIFSLDSPDNVWELWPGQWGACYKLFEIMRETRCSDRLADINPGKRGNIYFSGKAKCGEKSLLWLIIFVLPSSPKKKASNN